MNLIIHPPKSNIAFDIFNHPVYWYGIILTTAIAIGILLSFILIKIEYDAKKADEFVDFSPVLIVSSLIGARLFYVLGSFEYYKNNLKEILFINHGGISIYGAIIFGIIAFFIHLKKYKYNILRYFDLVSITLPLCQAIGRWGNYFNQEAYGKPANSFLQLYVDYKYRYPEYKGVSFYTPAFLYESILNLLLFILLITIHFKFKNIKSGTIFFLYLLLYGIIRIFIEQFRMDSIAFLNQIPIAQVISLVVIILSILGFIYIYKIKKFEP